jgi:hypothetical protein
MVRVAPEVLHQLVAPAADRVSLRRRVASEEWVPAGRVRVAGRERGVVAV